MFRLVLSDAAYAALCKRVYQRDGWKCRTPQCGSTMIQAHHIIYRSSRGPDVSWNLISLCNRCHDAIHVTENLVILPQIAGEAADADQGVKWSFVGGWHPRPSQSLVP